MLRSIGKTCFACAYTVTRAARRLARPASSVSAPFIICYHRVVADFANSAKTSIPSMLISTAMLERHVEWLAKISVPSVNMGSSNPVNITVNFPACAAGPNTNPVDYTATIDVCHAGDIAPLGLFGAGACGGASDGGQDRNTGNDAPVTRTIDDGSR